MSFLPTEAVPTVYLDSLQPPCFGRLRGLAAQRRDHRAPGQPVVTAPGRKASLDLSRSLLLLFLSAQVPGEAKKTLRGPVHPLQKAASHTEGLTVRARVEGWKWAHEIWGPHLLPPESDLHPAV